MSCVYIFWYDTGDRPERVKIGFTQADEPSARMRSFQTGAPAPVVHVYQTGLGRSEEKALHARFEQAPGAGPEWRLVTDELWALIIDMRDGKNAVCKTLRRKQRGPGAKLHYKPLHGPAPEIRVAADWSRPCPKCGKTQHLTFRQLASLVVQDQPYCCRGGKAPSGEVMPETSSYLQMRY